MGVVAPQHKTATHQTLNYQMTKLDNFFSAHYAKYRPQGVVNHASAVREALAPHPVFPWPWPCRSPTVLGLASVQLQHRQLTLPGCEAPRLASADRRSASM